MCSPRLSIFIFSISGYDCILFYDSNRTAAMIQQKHFSIVLVLAIRNLSYDLFGVNFIQCYIPRSRFSFVHLISVEWRKKNVKSINMYVVNRSPLSSPLFWPNNLNDGQQVIPICTIHYTHKQSQSRRTNLIVIFS